MWTKEKLVNVRERPGDNFDIDALKDASSLELMNIDAEKLPPNEKYELFQHRDNSWSNNGDWGANAVKNADKYIRLLKNYPSDGIHFEDDVFCDFGGNDGTVAEAWRAATGNSVFSVDLDALKQGWGKRSYPKVIFVNSLLEDIPLPDKSIDWAYCSHTLEHVADLEATMDEIARITRRGLFVVVPLENELNFRQAAPHMRASQNPIDWLHHLRHPDVRLVNWAKSFNRSAEMYIFYAMEDFGYTVNNMNWYWLDSMADKVKELEATP